MPCGVTDFGMTTSPSCMCQRMMVWAADLPCLEAIFPTASLSRTAPLPSGLYDSSSRLMVDDMAAFAKLDDPQNGKTGSEPAEFNVVWSG